MTKASSEKADPPRPHDFDRHWRQNHPWGDWEKLIVREGIKTNWQIWSQNEVADFLRRKRPGVQQASHTIRKKMTQQAQGKKTKTLKRGAR